MTSKQWSRKIITDLGIFFLLIALQAKATSPLQMRVEIGFEGFYKIGSWTPVRIFFENKGSSLQSRYGVFTADFQKVELWDSRWQKGDVLIKEEGIPLLVKLRLGAGKIFFLAFDFSRLDACY